MWRINADDALKQADSSKCVIASGPIDDGPYVQVSFPAKITRNRTRFLAQAAANGKRARWK